MIISKAHLGAFIAIVAMILAVGLRLSRPKQSNDIPRNLDEAHLSLERLLSRREIQEIVALKHETDMINYHMGLGMHIRNEWGLWKHLELARNMEALGFHHPDDMSATILQTFWCRLHGKPFRLEQKRAEYERYWRTSAPSASAVSPLDGARIFWATGSGSLEGTTWLGISTSDRSYWRWSFKSGVKPATPEDRKDLANIEKYTWHEAGIKTEDMLKSSHTTGN